MRRVEAADRSLTVAAPTLALEPSVPWDRRLPSAALILALAFPARLGVNLMMQVLTRSQCKSWPPVCNEQTSDARRMPFFSAIVATRQGGGSPKWGKWPRVGACSGGLR